MLLKNLNYVKLRYEELIVASKSFSTEEVFQLIRVKPNKIRGYFLGDDEYTYETDPNNADTDGDPSNPDY